MGPTRLTFHYAMRRTINLRHPCLQITPSSFLLSTHRTLQGKMTRFFADSRFFSPYSALPERHDRLQQLTRNNETYYEPYKKFQMFVPENATVALYSRGDFFQYPLFGEGITRRIIPIKSFWRGIQPVPGNADFLLYEEGYPESRPDDLHLGANSYLRKTGARKD